MLRRFSQKPNEPICFCFLLTVRKYLKLEIEISSFKYIRNVMAKNQIRSFNFFGRIYGTNLLSVLSDLYKKLFNLVDYICFSRDLHSVTTAFSYHGSFDSRYSFAKCTRDNHLCVVSYWHMMQKKTCDFWTNCFFNSKMMKIDPT